MKLFVITVLLVVLTGNVFAQKKEINSKTITNWDGLGDYGISADGKFAYYSHQNNGVRELVLVSITNNEAKKFPEGWEPTFTPDGTVFCFLSPAGLNCFNLTSGALTIKKGVEDYQSISIQNKHSLIERTGQNLSVVDFKGSVALSYKNVGRHLYNEKGKVMVIESDSIVEFVNLRNLKSLKIACQGAIDNFHFNQTGDRVFFLEYDQSQSSKLHFVSLSNLSVKTIQLDELIDKTNYKIIPSFGEFGENSNLLLKAQLVSGGVEDQDVVSNRVDVWNYHDAQFQSGQIEATKYHTDCLIAINVTDNTFTELENLQWKFVGVPLGRYALQVTRDRQDDAHWNPKLKRRFRIMSMDTFKTKSLQDINTNNLSLSDDGRYLIWTNGQQVYVKSTAANTINSLTHSQDLMTDYTNSGSNYTKKIEILGWLRDDKAVFVRDRYDIWMLDPTGVNAAKNISQYYGRKNRVKLDFCLDPKSFLKTVDVGDPLLLCGISDSTKSNLFLKILFERKTPVELLSNNGYLFCIPKSSLLGAPDSPKKSERSNVYVLTGQSCEDSPNLFVTKDFRVFKPISNIHPEREFNWMKGELFTWKDDEGNTLYGNLYSPESLDTTKKYPIIFHFYELKSNERYMFKAPGLSEGSLNIPWYVSKGYCVFVPDIWRMEGKQGLSALKSVESAAKSITQKYLWLDSSRMGIQGHSFGGYEANYIAMRSHLFKAAQSSAGIANLISFYGSRAFEGNSLASLTEVGQINMGNGCTPWSATDKYIENSPIFFVGNSRTPLLLQSNELDDNVPFTQAIELFTALRRDEKPVWLLQYDGSRHAIDGLKDQLDFTIRQQQFFDHFLKDKPMPMWMKSGIPAIYKGEKSGLSTQ